MNPTGSHHAPPKNVAGIAARIFDEILLVVIFSGIKFCGGGNLRRDGPRSRHADKRRLGRMSRGVCVREILVRGAFIVPPHYSVSEILLRTLAEGTPRTVFTVRAYHRTANVR